MALAATCASFFSSFAPKDTPKFCSDAQMKYPPGRQKPEHRIVDALLDEGGAYVHADYGRPLRLAVEAGDAPMVELLVRKYGADPGMMSHLAVMQAVRDGNVEIVEMLLEMYDASGYLRRRKPLPSNLFFGNRSPSLPYDKTRESNVFDGEYLHRDVLEEAARSDVPEMVALLVDKHGVGRKDPERLAHALRAAAKSGKSNTVSFLARRLKDDHGADVPVEALRDAAAFGHVDVVDLLCSEFGVDPHADGGIALKSNGGCKKVVDLLCGKFGVDASAHDNSALRLFASFGDAAMVDKLVREYGARGSDETALDTAAKQGHLSVVRLLMTEHGAIPPPLHPAAEAEAPENTEDGDPLSYAARVANEVLPDLEAYISMPPSFGFSYFVEEACRRRDRLRGVVHLHKHTVIAMQ